jgi:hypothetical protein
MSENRVLRRISGPKREKVARGWRRLHSEELHNLYVSPNTIRIIKSRRMRWAGHVAHMTEKRNACNISVGKPQGKRLLRRHKNSWEDNIRMDFKGVGWEGVNWMHLSQDRDQWRAVVNMVVDLPVP